MNILLICVLAFSQPAQVISDNNFATTIQFSLPDYQIEQTRIDGIIYDQVKLPSAVTYLNKGYPELPRLYKSIIINDIGEYSYRIVDAVYETLAVNTILPSKGNLTRDINPDLIPYEFSSFYNENRLFPENSIDISEPFIMRDYRGLTVHFNPFQYNPYRNELIVCKNMTVEIYRINQQGLNIKTRNQSAITISREFKDMYQDFFLNFNSTRYDTVLERAGQMLVITTSAYYNNIKPLVNWKRMKGIPTKVAIYPNNTGSGTAALKTYIQTEYNAGNLVYILIVGDAENVPPAMTVGVSVTDIADPVYTYLEGGDYYPDAFISRFSAGSPTDVDNQVNRTITYEKMLVTGGDWERKGMGVASNQSGSSPYVDSTRCNWLRTMLLGYNYLSVDRIYDSWGTIAMVSSGLNEGRSIVNYIGHGSATSWGSTGFSNSNVNALTNYNKLPYIISVACYNGDFQGTTCFGEAWLRAGTPANPAGAIAFYGSSISQSWVPPTVSQSAACSLLVQDRNHTIGGIMFNGSCHMIAAYLPALGGVEEFQAWHIFGDASVPVRTLPPQPISVVHQPIFYIGMNSINVTVPGVTDALVGIYKDTLLYGSGYTNSSGTVLINLSQPVTTFGYLNITVTAYNKATYYDSIPVVPASYPYIIVGSSVLDAGINGQVNPGESINYGIWAKNVGVGTAQGVYGKLLTSDSYVTVNTDSSWFGNIPADDSTYSNPLYNFHIANNCPNNHLINLSIQFSDVNDSTFNSYQGLRVYAPVITYQNAAVVGGNNNGIFNRGETVNIVVTVKNEGGADAENVSATLLTSAPLITILDNAGSFGTITPGNNANNSANPFTVCSDPTIVAGTMVQFRVAVNYGFLTDTFQFSLPVEIYLANLEDNNGNYIPAPATGGWEWGVPTSGPNAAHSGTKVWATVLGGNYANSANWTLTTPELTATGTNPQLKFWHWYSFEGTSTLYDGGNIKISTNNGGTWTVVTPDGGYTGTAYSSTPGVGGQPIFGGSNQNWSEVTATLPVSAGQRFLLRWHFGSDGSVNSYAGWYIDDITGIGFAVMPPPNNDVGVEAILSPGAYHFPNTPMTPTVRVKNFGALAQVNCPVVCSIISPNSILRYTNTQTVNISAGDTLRVNFAAWTPTVNEVCTVKVRTSLVGDEVPANDGLVQAATISPTSQIQIGTATTNARVEPMDRYYNYSSHEAIYLQSEIGIAGTITQIGYYKESGSNIDPITPVTIYMKHTTDASLASGTYSLTSYTQVYNGAYTNNATSGWMEVQLTTPFQYNNTDNLSILILKGNQAYISTNYPYWRYTTTTVYRTRGARSDASQPSSLTQTYNRPNIRVMITSLSGIEQNTLSTLPLITALYAPKPNPVVNGLAHITYSIAEPSKVSLKIYDASGRNVRTLVNNQQQTTNNYSLIWDGKDDNKRAVAEGIYFYTLETPNQKFTKKMVFTR